MTITTSKQLAKALGSAWKPRAGLPPAAFHSDSIVEQAYEETFSAAPYGAEDMEVYGADPRAAVLALADRLEAEAQALRESVKEGP